MTRRVLLALGLALAAAATTIDAAHGASTTPAPAGEVGATPVIESLAPLLPAPGGTLVVTGRVDVGDVELRNVDVRLRVGTRPIDARSRLSQVELTAPGPTGAVPVPPVSSLRDGTTVDGTTERIADDAAAGSSAQFSIETPLDVLGLDGFGAHVLSIEVRATLPEGDRSRVGITRTFLVWSPSDSQVQPTPMAWLWPVLSDPVLDAGNAFVDAQSADELSAQLSDAGRLGVLAREAAEAQSAGTPVLWVVDADTLATVNTLATGARVRTPDGTTRRAPDETAGTWLDALSQRLADAGAGAVTLLPYGDPDLVAVRRAGREGTLVTAGATAQDVAQQLIGSAPSAEPAWPAGGRLDRETLSTLDDAGVTTVVVSDQTLPPRGTPPYTPDAVASFPELPDGPTAWVVDTGASSAVARDVSTAEGEVMARQRFLAETALVTAERPGDPRTLLVAPPRRWAPPQEWASTLLQITREADWLTPLAPDALRAAEPQSPARRGPEYTATDRAAEVSQSQLADLTTTQQDAAVVTSTLADPEEATQAFTVAGYRGQSTAWRGRADEGAAFVSTIEAQAAALESGVRIVPTTTPLRLSSDRGTIPVSIANDLDQDVTVRLRLTATPAVRMTFTEPPPITVGAGGSTTVGVEADAAASGLVEVEVQLTSPEGDAFGEAALLEVRASAYGRVAALAVGGALALLFVAVVVRIVGRIRRGARRWTGAGA